LGAGLILVTVPNDAKVKVNARARAGGYELLGRTSEGWASSETISRDGCPDGPVLNLNLRNGAGFIKVERENGDPKRTCAAA
jgi:hypothetical protein